MSIELHCENCGKRLQAPDKAAGKQSKCPSCGGSIYVPTPAEEIEELPLASEDDTDLQREQALQAERRRLDRILAGDEETAGGRRSSSVSPQTAGPKIQTAVLAYLMAMRDGDLPRADSLLESLTNYQAEARGVVDQLIADQLPPAQLAKVPPAVYQGFLKQLRSQL
jgi:predicted  nucleic acid-binding Zn-ribbon protein